jgi:hypothetical protein
MLLILPLFSFNLFKMSKRPSNPPSRIPPYLSVSDRFYQPQPKVQPKPYHTHNRPDNWIPPTMTQLLSDYDTANYRRESSEENEVLVSFGQFIKHSFRRQLSVLRNPQDVDDIILTLYNTVLLPQHVTYERNYNFSRDPLGWKKLPPFQKFIKEMWRGITRKTTVFFS